MCPVKKCKDCHKYLYFRNFVGEIRSDGTFYHRRRCNDCRKLIRKDNPETAARWRANNKEKHSVAAKRWREQNLERAKEGCKRRAKEWSLKNREAFNLHQRKAYQANPKKFRELQKQQRAKNPGLYAARWRQRKLAKMQRCPKWLTKEQHEAIANWYKLAKEIQWLSEEKLHVDHIIPLRGKHVSGLHVPWNLQILPRSMNIKKSNKLI